MTDSPLAQGQVRAHTRTRETPLYRTVNDVFLITVLPFLGINTTAIEHLPARMPLMVIPANMQYRLPFRMLMRIDPCDFFGIDSDTAFATCAAVTLLPRPTFICFTTPLFTDTELPITLTTEGTTVVEVDVEVVVPFSGASDTRS